MKHSEHIDKISAALAKAQGEIDGAKKAKTNPAFRSKYADLSGCVEACRDALTECGIAVLQLPQPCDDGVLLVTMLTHSSGQWISDGGLHVPANKKDAQGFGSALTYARRYGLCAMVGIAPEDDDGNAATKSYKPEQKGITPTAGAMESMSPKQVQNLNDIAGEARRLLMEGMDIGAAHMIDAEKLDNEEKTALWSLLDSKERTALKKAWEELKKQLKEAA